MESAIGFLTSTGILKNGTIEAYFPQDLNDVFQKSVPTVVFSVVIVFVISLILKWQRKEYPPVVPAFPVVGGFLKFIKGPLKLMDEYYPKLGSVFTVNLFHKKITFLIGPEVSSHFYKAAEEDLSQEEVYKYSRRTFGPGVVFAIPYSIRMEQFRFFADSLKSSRLRTYVEMMVQEAEEYFSKWGDEGEVDLKEELSNLIILTASRCLLGKEVREQMFGRVSDLFHELDAGMIPISVVAPWLPIEAHRRRDRARAELGTIFKAIIEKRRNSGVKENDMLQVFIDSKYKSDGRSTTDGEITGMLIAALFAGQHTSSVTSTWVGAYLATSKDTYAPAIEQEQLEIIAEYGESLNYDILNAMDNLHRVMKEVLRLHPPLIMLLRYVHTEFSVDSKEGKTYKIPKGSIVATSPAFSGRLPHIYNKEDEFDPTRFAAPREEDKYMPFSFTAFGGGRHGCMGENFAYMQVKTIWSILVRKFEFELLSPFPEMNLESLVVGPKGDVRVRYKRRSLKPLPA